MQKKEIKELLNKRYKGKIGNYLQKKSLAMLNISKIQKKLKLIMIKF